MKSTVQESIIKSFEGILDWDGRYEEIINIGKSIEPFPNSLKTENNRVSGCQSRVWLTSVFKDEKFKFYADSDSMIVRGLVALLIRVYSDKTASQILAEQPYFITQIGFDKHLTASRASGLYAVVKRIKDLATNKN